MSTCVDGGRLVVFCQPDVSSGFPFEVDGTEQGFVNVGDPQSSWRWLACTFDRDGSNGEEQGER